MRETLFLIPRSGPETSRLALKQESATDLDLKKVREGTEFTVWTLIQRILKRLVQLSYYYSIYFAN